MVFYKTFPRTTDKSTYPVWEEITLTDAEEKEQEEIARRENINLMKECIDDADKIMQEKNLKPFQTDKINIAIALFEKRASHEVYFKERKAKEKFDEKFTVS
ncbi:hypothetical protein JXB41_00560 [Candidatus Woesearchaeota archaeon]|nr:hypothetical protein [Candidatus Woesearchaeota archaeon]